jgi:hypothetical protein
MSAPITPATSFAASLTGSPARWHSGGGLHLRVPEQLADRWQALTGSHADRGEGVPQVEHVHVVAAGACPQPLAEPLQVGERLAGQGPCDHMRVAQLVVNGSEDIDRGLGKIDMLPCNLTIFEPAAGEHQQADRGNSAR